MPPKGNRSPLSVIFLTVLLDLLGFGMIIPLLPLYAKNMHATDVKIGVLMAIYSAMQMVFAPIWGRLSDRVGRRPVLLVSIFGSCISQLGYGLAPSFWWLVAARGFAGLCGANISAAQAYVADVTTDRERAAGMARLGVAMGLGFVFGPLLGSAFLQFGQRAPFFVASGLAACNFALAVPILVEPKPSGERSHARSLHWSALVRTVSTPRLLTLIALFFIVTFGFSNLEATFSLFLDRQFGFRDRSASLLFAYIGVIMIFTQGLLVRRLVPVVGERRLMVAGTLMMAISMFALHYATGLALLLSALGVMSVGNAINNPSLSSLISRAAAGDRQGGVLGVAQSVGALARILGPLAGTFALRYGPTAPYVTAGLVLALASVIAAGLVEQPAPAPPDEDAPTAPGSAASRRSGPSSG